MDVVYEQAPPMPIPSQFPMQGPGGFASAMSDTIASMRWESDPLIHQLYRTLGGYEISINENNDVVRKRDPKHKPLMNDRGIERMIALVRGMVNPVTALSNIDDEEANEIIRQVLYRIIIDLVLNQELWQVDTSDRSTIMSVMKVLVFMQVKRAVGGHESQNYKTQTLEQNLQSNINQQQVGNSWFPFGRQKK